jgi:lipopolysaccharide biosynthesis protein
MRPVCLFAHYDPGGRIRPYVLHYLAALNEAGYRVVVATSGITPPEADIVAAGSAGADQVVCRANAGIDFGAWQALLQAGHADGAPGVLFANDSVYGPFLPLGPIIAPYTRPSNRAFDAWGMVESVQGIRHLQSWFMHLDATVLASPAVRRVFEQPFPNMVKQEIIARGELALGAAMDAEGVRCGALYDRYTPTRLSRTVPSNPMHLDWRYMLTSGRVPFLKGELLRCNPLAVAWVDEWISVVGRLSSYPVDCIHEHLYAYTGREPAFPGASFPTPHHSIALPARLFYAAATRDHGTALRSLLALRRRKVSEAIGNTDEHR